MELDEALEAWRGSRDPQLADLIDRIAGTPTDKPPRGRIQAWWMDNADPYDATKVAALVACADVKLGGVDNKLKPQHAIVDRIRHPRPARENAIARLAAIARWPHDPRAATILLRWFIAMPVRWDPLETGTATLELYSAIADLLVELADPRVVPAIEDLIETPRGPTQQLRAHQQALAKEIVRKLPAPAPAALPEAHAHETSLWAEVARRRDELEPRRVLADLLVERGDPRGELIALQCAHTAKAAAKARSLIKRHWADWLGDIALIANRNGTEFRDGMLHEIRVGTPKSPDWAFSKVHGHRELATVRVVRPGHVKPADYATFLASPNLAPDIVGIDAPETIAYLKRGGFRTLVYSHQSVRDYYRTDYPPLAETFEQLAKLAPELEAIEFDDDRHAEIPRELEALRLRALFPKLRSIKLVTRSNVTIDGVETVAPFSRDDLER